MENSTSIVMPSEGLFMYDVISSTLNKLTPWTGVETVSDNTAYFTVHNEISSHVNALNNILYNNYIVDAVI